MATVIPPPGAKAPPPAVFVDRWLLAVTLGLLMGGYVMMTSASLHLSEDGFHFAKHQLLHLGLGLGAGGLVCAVPLKEWLRLWPALLIIGFGLLLAVKLPGLGVTVNGSTRWLSVGGVRVQVSEVFKWIANIYLASYIVRHGEELRRRALGLYRPLFVLALGAGLMLWQPDFGAAAILMATAVTVLFLAGARVLPLLSLLGGLAAVAVGLVVAEDYRLKRLEAFFDPFAHSQDSGYQLVQALIAFGRGGWFGVGLGNSVQKMFYLPEGHTDFLLAVVGEELGLVGVMAVGAGFGLLVWRIFAIAQCAHVAGEVFGAFLAYGVGIWLGLQALVNMGVNLGVLPTKGLTLPLMSYGGGSLVMSCLALGQVARVYAEAKAKALANKDVSLRRGLWRRS
ncbi:MAG: putative lipid II flippase FtsW [Methylohalobius sp.]|nr:putative lipid II flippase FtsW [Methylohalobius sp.]